MIIIMSLSSVWKRRTVGMKDREVSAVTKLAQYDG